MGKWAKIEVLYKLGLRRFLEQNYQISLFELLKVSLALYLREI